MRKYKAGILGIDTALHILFVVGEGGDIMIAMLDTQNIIFRKEIRSNKE